MLGTHKLTSCLPRAGALHQKSWHPSVLALRPESFFDGLGTRLGPLEAENGETPPALSLDSFKRRGRSGLWAGTTLGAHPLQNRSPGPSWDPSRQALRPARTSRGPSAGPRTPRSWRSPPWISTSSCPPSLDRDIWRSKRQKDRCRFCSNRGHEGARCRRKPSSDTGEQIFDLAIQETNQPLAGMVANDLQTPDEGRTREKINRHRSGTCARRKAVSKTTFN